MPVTAVWVGEPQLHVQVGIKIFHTFRISPIGAFACLLTGLISSTFASIGPLYGLDLGFGQSQIVMMMAATQLGALFLQFPLGYLSDRLDRRAMMLWLSLVLAALCGAMVFLHAGMPFWVFLVAFSLFGGLTEIFYPLGVAHANDKADPKEFVTLSSNLLLIWAFGGTIGPALITVGRRALRGRYLLLLFHRAVAAVCGLCALAPLPPAEIEVARAVRRLSADLAAGLRMGAAHAR